MISSVLNRWSFERVSQHEKMNGAMFTGRKEIICQEDRLGHEQCPPAGYLSIAGRITPRI
nr:hypothetical protein [Desulfobacterales bacterium]